MTGPTDDDIEAAYIGDPPIHNDIVHLVEYRSTWAEQFQREAGRIQDALGSRALSIDHVGSTSVPGLAAKPIIDIVLTVADSSNEAAYVPHLEAAGYQLRIREPDWYEHRLFKGPDINVNIHLFSSDCVEVERMIVFHDQLRNNDDDRHLYERTKPELARRHWKYVQHYANAKSEVITTILTAQRKRQDPVTDREQLMLRQFPGSSRLASRNSAVLDVRLPWTGRVAGAPSDSLAENLRMLFRNAERTNGDVVHAEADVAQWQRHSA